ncbi:acyltransferase family protein [Ottowia flava]|uniref:Acyltransferase family protein n=1 Tax=Ottowia flava TaxID=2675430 RepID=A0ABW4KQI6_9BURK
MRALAVILVLAVHASPAKVPNGFIGVDIFFVISGFLITGILMDDLQSGRFSLRNFYVRRINRLFPALLLVLISVLIAGSFVMYPDEYLRMAFSAWMSTVFAANIGFFSEAGYWDTSSKLKPLLHLWSLGVEEQFYLAWPLLLCLCFRKRGSLLLVALVIAMVSLALNLYLTPKNQAAAFYLPFGRLWELAAGGVLAWVQRAQGMQNSSNARDAFHGSANALSWGALLLLLANQITPMDDRAFPGYYAVVVVLAAAIFIAAGPQAWLNRRVFSHPVLVYIGKISYPLYLWHWPLLVFARLAGEGQWTVSHRNYAVLGSIALAMLTFHGVEQPLAKIKRRGRLALWLLALMVCMGTVAALASKAVLLFGLKAYIIPPMERLGHAKPAVQSTGSIVLLGDSNAGHLEYGLKWIYGDRTQSFWTASWPYLDGTQYRDGHRPPAGGKGTPALTEEALRKITGDAAVRLVILSNAYSQYLIGDGLRSVSDSAAGETKAQAYEAGLRRTVQRLLDSGKQVLVIESIPTYGNLATVMACSTGLRPWLRHQPAGCTQSRSTLETERRPYQDVLDRAFEGMSGVTRFNTLDELCDKDQCYVHRDGEQLYYDSGHFTAEGSQLMSAAIARRIEVMLAAR